MPTGLETYDQDLRAAQAMIKFLRNENMEITAEPVFIRIDRLEKNLAEKTKLLVSLAGSFLGMERQQRNTIQSLANHENACEKVLISLSHGNDKLDRAIFVKHVKKASAATRCRREELIKENIEFRKLEKQLEFFK